MAVVNALNQGRAASGQTRVTGRDCTQDHRFQDGYSAALSTDAIHALITGVM